MGLGIGIGQGLAFKGLKGDSGPRPDQQLEDIVAFEAHLKSFFAKDAPIGLASAWTARGTHARTATASVGQQPTKADADADVVFTGGQPHRMSWAGGDGSPSENDATVAHRWGGFIAKITPSAADYIDIGCINGTSGNANHRQPYVYARGAQQKLGVMWYDSAFRFAEGACEANAAAYQFLFWHRRGGKLHANVNGIWLPPVDFQSGAWNNVSASSFIGAPSGNMGSTMGLKWWGLGQSELSDDAADQLVGLVARYADREDLLVAAGHPYATTAPHLTEADFGTRYNHDEVAWQAFRASNGQGNNDYLPGDPLLDQRFQHRASPEPAHPGYVCVLKDDFTKNTLVSNRTGGLPGVWKAPCDINPGANVNRNATNAQLTDTDVYRHNPADGGTIAIRMSYVGGVWKSGSFSLLDHTGNGRSYGPPVITRMRFRFATSADHFPGGIFPGVKWRYDDQYQEWRTRNRGEWDDLELLGTNAKFINVSFHGSHPPSAPGSFTSPDVRTHDDFEKVAGYDLNAAKGFPQDLDIWNNAGAFHEIVTKMERDYFYVYLDGYEIARDVSPKALDRRWSLITNLALDLAQGPTPAPETAHWYEMIIDDIEVWRPAEVLEEVPAGFTARPVLSIDGGVWEAGHTITLSPNAAATATDQWEIRYYLTDGTALPTLTALTNLSAEGLGWRASVRNLGLKDRPMAWTADTPPIAASAVPWTPAAENENHLGWWDTLDPAETTVVSGRFSRLNDLSGHGRHAVNTNNGATQPEEVASSLINGKRAARAATANDVRMQISSVWTPPSNFLLTVGASNASQLQVTQNGVTSLSGTGVLATDTPAIIMFHWGAWGWEFRKNDVVVASDATPQATSGAIYFVGTVKSAGGGNAGRVFDVQTTPVGYLFNRLTGTGRQWDGDFGTLIIRAYDNASALRRKYAGFLAHRWWGAGDANPLASDHVHKHDPPTM